MKNLKMKKEFKVIADLLPSDTRVLDVGCGDGSLMNHLIKEKNIVPNPDGIRDFRNDVLNGKYKQLYEITNWSDFYSTSMCRDLCFHRQESCYSLIEIKTDKGHDSFLVDEPEFLKTLKGFIDSMYIKFKNEKRI